MRAERAAGTTKYNFSKMMRLAFDSLTAFSAAPLRLATWLGLFGGLLSVVFVIAAVVVLAALAFAHAGLLAGFALSRAKTVRHDPVAGWMVGALAAAWLDLSWLDHPSASEYYFLRSLLPFAAAAVSWLVVAGVRGRSRRTIVRLGMGGIAAGTAIAVCAELVTKTATGSRAAQIETLARPLLVGVGVAVIVVVAWLVVARLRPGLAVPGTAFAILAVIGLPIGAIGADGWSVRGNPGSGPFASKFWRVFPDEAAAAQWLGRNSAPDDVVVANTFCRPAGRSAQAATHGDTS